LTATLAMDTPPPWPRSPSREETPRPLQELQSVPGADWNRPLFSGISIRETWQEKHILVRSVTKNKEDQMASGWCSFKLWINPITFTSLVSVHLFYLVFIKYFNNFWSIRRSRIYSVDELPHKKRHIDWTIQHPPRKCAGSSLHHPSVFMLHFWKVDEFVGINSPKMRRQRVKHINPNLATCRGAVLWVGLWFSWRNLSRSSLVIDHVQSLRLFINVESPF